MAFLCLLLILGFLLGEHFTFLSQFLPSRSADLLEQQAPAQTAEAKSILICFPLLEFGSASLMSGNVSRSSFRIVPSLLLAVFEYDFRKEQNPHAVGCFCSLALCKSGRHIHPLNDIWRAAMSRTHELHW